MLPHASLLLSIGLVLSVADPVPQYDVKSTCRAAVNFTSGEAGRTVAMCLAGEESAHNEIANQWATIPTPDRRQCIETVAVGGSPSYVELLICLQLARYARASPDK